MSPVCARVCAPLEPCFFFFHDPATPEIYTLSLHDALPITVTARRRRWTPNGSRTIHSHGYSLKSAATVSDRKSTRLNSSHANISYAVFCLKKKNKHSLETQAAIQDVPAQETAPRTHHLAHW